MSQSNQQPYMKSMIHYRVKEMIPWHYPLYSPGSTTHPSIKSASYSPWVDSMDSCNRSRRRGTMPKLPKNSARRTMPHKLSPWPMQDTSATLQPHEMSLLSGSCVVFLILWQYGQYVLAQTGDLHKQKKRHKILACKKLLGSNQLRELHYHNLRWNCYLFFPNISGWRIAW